MIRAIVKDISRALALGLAGLLMLLVILTLWQVFARYVLSQPDPYSEEVIRLLLMWLGLLSGAYCVYTRAHVGFSLLRDRLAPEKQARLDQVIRIIISVFAAIAMVFGGIRLVLLTLALEQRTPVLEIPVGAVYGVIPLSGALIVLFALFSGPDHSPAPETGKGDMR